MASSYTTAGSTPGVRVLSQTQTLPVELIAIWTQPHNVYLVVPVPLVAFNAGTQDTYLTPPAELVEQLFQAGQVTAIVYVQTVDGSQLLAASLDVTVTYQPTTGSAGPFSAIVRLPFTVFESLDAFAAPLAGGTPSAQIEAAYSQLVKTAKL